jgi:uncharacterized MAPEG superfamily protein
MALELEILALMTLLFMLAWIPASVCKYQTYGLGWLLSNRSVAGLPPLPEWGQRAERAHNNLKENFPGFAVAVLLLAITGGFTQGTRIASAVFIGARLVHMPAYIQGHVWIRSISWAIGLGACLYLLAMAVSGLVKF